MTTKICSKCKEEKPHDEFYKHVGSKDSVQNPCKLCINELQRERSKDPKVRARKKEHHRERSKDPEYIAKRNEYNRKRRKDPKNKEKEREYQKERYKKDPKVRIKKRAYDLKRKYGITFNDFNSMITFQNSNCSICRKEFSNSCDMNVDHCHTSGKVRSILCSACNSGLGYFQDDPARLREAAEYIERHSNG